MEREPETPPPMAELDHPAGLSAAAASGGAPTAMSVETIRELFRLEARELLAGMSHRLLQLGNDPDDASSLADVAARGHALKGSAALAELPALSRAGAVLQRAAELASEAALHNRDAAAALLRATRAALVPAGRMLDDCAGGESRGDQELLAEMMQAFDTDARRELEARLDADESDSEAALDFEERRSPDDSTERPAELDTGASDQTTGDPSLEAALAETFLIELAELLSAVPDALLGMIDPAQQADHCADLARIFHTVKGGAATVGRADLREAARGLQEAFEAFADEPEQLPLDPDQVARLRAPLASLFLAAGLEPPSAALDALWQCAEASLIDDAPEEAEIQEDVPPSGGALGDRAPEGAAEAEPRPWEAPDGPLETSTDGAPIGTPVSHDRESRSRAPSAQDARPSAPEIPTASIEREIMEAFVLDAEAALDACETALLHLERNPKDRNQLRTLFRQFHTLKGAAAAVGLGRIAEQLHAGESLLESIIEGATRHDPEALVELLLEFVDSVAGLLAEARGLAHEHRILSDATARMEEMLARAPGPEPAASDAGEGRDGTANAVGDDAAIQAAAEPDPGARETAPPAVHSGDPESAIVRVHASRLDLLMNRVSELVVSRTRMEDAMGAFHELKDKLSFGRLRLQETIEGFRGFEFNQSARSPEAWAARAGVPVASPLDFSDLEFDKYDDFNVLARTLVELTADAGEITEQLSGLIETLAEETRQVSKVTSSLQRTVTGMRLLSLDTLFRRLQRPAREAARQVGKQVDLICIGGEVQLDRALIESLYGPLLHLVRNAVSHGIEPLIERRAAGKPDIGLVEIRAVQRHGSVEISLRDDGRGLDFAAIRAKGETLGLLEDAAAATREELAALIFRPGFSTRSEVTDLAGRGIGMDVVAGEVEQLRGSVSVDSRDGTGATFRITLPLTAVIDQVLVLRAGPEVYALSHGPIETVLNVDPQDVVADEAGMRVRVGDAAMPALSLAALVGARSRIPPLTAVVLRLGEQRTALLVDRIEAQREAVVRPLGRLFAGHPFISSATFSGDGQVVFVLDGGRLESWIAAGRLSFADAPELEDAARAGAVPPAAYETPGEGDAAVLWADDSISVRALAAHFLTAEGWTSRTAVDGSDALAKLRSGNFRVLVTDLEMPRMHGYELLHEVRSDPRLRDLPVIVCSSRSSEKHRRAAREAGASGYLTKPFTREALAAALREFLAAPRPEAS